MELVDILMPPNFEKTGQIKSREQANRDGDWRGSFNLWVVQNEPEPAIVYQLRHPDSRWAPGKLDASAGGAYSAGEVLRDGLREADEELGKQYDFNDLVYVGRRLNITSNVEGVFSRTVCDICMVIDNSALGSYVLQEDEVSAIVICPLHELRKVHTEDDYSFEAHGLDFNGDAITLTVDKNSFPYNWDNYHFKMVLLLERFFRGDEDLIY